MVIYKKMTINEEVSRKLKRDIQQHLEENKGRKRMKE
jgi:hypothetical protein